LYKGKLSSITLNSAVYDEESADISAFAGKIVYNTVLDVTLSGDINPGLPFITGLNHFKFVLDFDESRNAWVIIEMTRYEPPETPEATESPENS
ncbi:MAG: hypothetical protein PHV32_07590, partial [Eubacteriales bacterium]|nr:hypothetical protein [Eubacteriales bacterium]